MTWFLNRLSKPYAEIARRVWTSIAERVDNIDVPQAGPTPDGGFQFVWDKGPHHIEVDAYPDGRLEWFYRNRLTGEVEGADEATSDIPPTLAARLELAHTRS